jgi:hypothetical protein
MPRRGQAKPRPVADDDPHGMPAMQRAAVEWMRVRGYSQATVTSREVLTAGKADEVMNDADIGDALGLRGRAILEASPTTWTSSVARAIFSGTPH